MIGALGVAKGGGDLEEVSNGCVFIQYILDPSHRHGPFMGIYLV